MTHSHHRIIVRNFSSVTQYFHIFQKRATFHSASTIVAVSCGSLGCEAVGNYASTGAEINFELGRQVYAGAVSSKTGAPLPHSTDFSSDKTPRFPVSTTRAIRQIGLSASESEKPSNYTIMATDPLGLSKPAYQPDIPAGAFGVTVPPYDPSPRPELYWGVATLSAEGAIFLSSYITPPPNSTIACSPQQVFFVKTGFKKPGDAMPYDEANAARCDLTTGFTRILVVYNADGTFTTSTDL